MITKSLPIREQSVTPSSIHSTPRGSSRKSFYRVFSSESMAFAGCSGRVETKDKRSGSKICRCMYYGILCQRVVL